MLGVILLTFSTQYFRQQQTETLQYAAEKAEDIIDQNLRSHAYVYVTRDEVEELMGLVRDASGATVFFCDLQGHVVMCCEGDSCSHTSTVLPERIRQKASSGAYSAIGSLGGFLQGAYFVYGQPYINLGALGGYVFAVSPVSDIFGYLLRMLMLYLLSSALMLLGSSIIVNYSTGVLTGPLRAIGNAASRFGSGDLTARVRVEGDDEIANLATVFNDMADSIEELENTRRSFVANLSHELRTPMTTISGYIAGILDGTIPEDQRDRYLSITLEEVKRLSRLSQSLLDIARMEASDRQAELSEVDVWEVILSVMLGSERRISEKNIEVLELNPQRLPALCNADMLHQVIYNLVDNAIKFTPAGGELSVRAGQQGDRVEIVVRNTGEGIPPEDLSRVFERFYKSDKSRALDKTGTGLGLYIVKTLVERMGGSISVESELGSYAEFTVLLKAPPPQPQKPAEKRNQPRKLPRMKQKGKERGTDE